MAIDPTLMRTRPQWQNWYLAVDKPPIIWRGRVKGDHARGAYDIDFDGGALVDARLPEVDFEIWFGNTVDQKDIGVSRIRNGALPGAWDTGTFRIASNDMDLADDDYITVKQNIRPTAILPSIDGVYEDEDKAYNDENENQHPLARIGPPAAGFLSNGILTVDFRSDDEAIASGALPDTYDWQFEDGDQSSAVANPGNINFTTTGRKWVTHTVTDDQVPAKSHTRYSQVYVFDTDAPPITGFQVSNLSGDRDSGGWRATVTVHQDASESEFPDLAQVVIFCEAYWDGTQTDVGYGWVGRENIMFVGYVVEDSVTKDPETSVVTFDIISIVELMKQITCWGASLKDDATPTSWHEIKDMNLNLEAFHVFTEHTTIDKIADIYLHLYYDDVYGGSPTEVTMKYTDLGEGPVYDQIKTQIGEAGRALLINNKYGQIYLEPNAQLALSTNRPTDEMWTILHDDWRDKLDLGPEFDGVYECCQVDFIGFYYSGSDPKPYGSLAPGRQWPTGSVQKVTGVRVNSQTDANAYSGVFELNYNNPFTNVSVALAGFWPVVDIAPQRYIKITLASGDTQRGLVWDNVLHIPKNVSVMINGEGLYGLTDVILEQAIGSATGVDNIIPEADPDPDPPPPIPPPAPPLPPPTVYAALLYTQDQIGVSTDFFDVVSPHWISVKGEITGDIYKVVVGDEQQAYATSEDGVWYCENILATVPTWTCFQTLVDARSETGDGAGEFQSLEITSDGTIYLAWHLWDYILGGYWVGDNNGITFTRWALYDPPGPTFDCKMRTRTARSTWAIYPDAENVWIACAGGGCGFAAIWKNGTYQQLSPSAPSDQDAIVVIDGYAVSWNGWIWTAASNYDTKWSDTLQVYGGLGVSVLDGDILAVIGANLYRNTVPLADSRVVFGVGLWGAHATYHQTSDEIIWVPRSSVTLASGKSMCVWSDDAFDTSVDKTGDWFAECGDPYSGASGSDGDLGNAATVIIEY